MEDYDKLMVGDQSTDGRIIIADKDRLCYLVKSGSKGSFSIRTISKQLLGEFIDYYRKNPNKKAEDARVELKELSDIDKYEYGYNATLTAMAKMILDPKNELVRKGNPAESSRTENHLLKTTGLQQIYYGAPGTGKSKTIKDLTFGESVIRTTFHPDSDYASFVGTYKPITEEVDLRDCNGKKVIDDDTKEVVKEERIAYKFIPQAFLEAYVKAWKKLGSSKKQYLIIEEINRGNCAQIFGDLFQLLDRNEYGFSDYPIVADKDMQKYLEKEFAGWEITNKDEINQLYGEANMVSLIMKGERLVLPSNLYIWATMNTSDQSLFPIDSAFKRRWDWKYVPIREGRDKETNAKLNWYINTGDKQYNWWSFISQVNKLIGSLTNSEDKKLGYFFCKAKDGEIDADLFVSKVIFYLWNDVFKDYGFDDKDFQDEEGKILSFDRFYEDKNGKTNVDIAIVEQFLENLGVEKASFNKEEEEIDAAPSSNETKGNDDTKYKFNGSKPLGKSDLGISIIKQYLKEHSEMEYSEIKETFPDSMLGKKLKLIGLIVTRQEIENAAESYKQKAYGLYKKDRKFYSSDGVEFYVSNWWNITNIDSIIQFAKEQGWTVEPTK